VSIASKRKRFRLIRSRATGVALLAVMSFLVLGVVFAPAVGKVSGQGSLASQSVDEKERLIQQVIQQHQLFHLNFHH
jgi:hypothetical protein